MVPGKQSVPPKYKNSTVQRLRTWAPKLEQTIHFLIQPCYQLYDPGNIQLTYLGLKFPQL